MTNSGLATTGKATGTVKFFDRAKGYGFIYLDGGDDRFSVYVRYLDIVMDGRKSLATGDRVAFHLIEQVKGRPRALNVVVLERA